MTLWTRHQQNIQIVIGLDSFRRAGEDGFDFGPRPRGRRGHRVVFRHVRRGRQQERQQVSHFVGAQLLGQAGGHVRNLSGGDGLDVVAFDDLDLALLIGDVHLFTHVAGRARQDAA
jgi:hypothetical protein